MTQTQLSPDAHEIVSYLLATKSRVSRTKQAIREACHLTEPKRAEEAFKQLVAIGYLSDVGESTYELSQIGLKYARTTNTKKQVSVTNRIEKVEGGTVTVSGYQDITATPINTPAVFSKPDIRSTLSLPEERDVEKTRVAAAHELPTIFLHPMRMTNLLTKELDTINGQPHKGVGMRFLLAFETLKDVLPIPLLDGDVLGRSRNTNIWLRHDEFVSLKHCRFKLKRERNAKHYSLYVEDLGSSNGTCVDSIMIEPNKAVALKHGSRLQIGNTVLIVVQIPY
jgi:hypothetical protein